MKREAITIFSSTKGSGSGSMFYDIWSARELTFQLFSREIAARYRQSILGYIWVILPTLMLLFTFIYIKNNIVSDNYKLETPYPAFLIVGLILWQIFSVGLTKTTQCLSSSQAIITKVNFCRESLVFAAFGQSILELLIRLALAIPALLYFKVDVCWTIVFVPFIILLISLLTIGLGFFLTLCNGIFRDIGNALPMILPFWMLATPVAYPPLEGMPYVLLNTLNPMSPFIIAARDLIFTGSISNPISFTSWSIASILIFIFGWRFFRMAIPRIAERV